MDNNNGIRNCLYCAKELKGRKDKKFCNDGCRNTFHNDLNSPINEMVNPIINILKENRAIVLGLLEKAKYNATREQLLKAGLNFKYSTEHFFNFDSHYYFYFDVGIKQLTESDYMLWYRKQYMDDYHF
jgi:hypothetical protein